MEVGTITVAEVVEGVFLIVGNVLGLYTLIRRIGSKLDRLIESFRRFRKSAHLRFSRIEKKLRLDPWAEDETVPRMELRNGSRRAKKTEPS